MVVGTAGLRQAANSDEFLNAARERAGVEVEVISGEEEARLAYLAAAEALHLGEGRLGVFETGGGSSQFTFGEGGHVTERVQPRPRRGPGHRAVRARPGPWTRRRWRRRGAEIASQLEALEGRPPLDVLAGIGGAITNLAGVQLGLERYEPDRVARAGACSRSAPLPTAGGS